MTYRIDKLKINAPYGREGFKKINELYEDIFFGKIPLIYENRRKSNEDLIAIAQYDNYQEDTFDYTVFASDYDALLEIFRWINYGDIELFEGEGSTIKQARNDAHTNLLKRKLIKRTFNNDFEWVFPKWESTDGKFHCLLFVGIENKYAD